MKVFCGLLVRGVFVSETGGDGQDMEFRVNDGAVGFQHEGQKNGIGKAVGNVISSAERMSDGVDVAHIGFGEGTACIVGGPEHVSAGVDIEAFFDGGVEIFKDKFHGLEGIFPGAVSGGVADIGLHGVGQGIHSGGGGDERRQAKCHLRVQHCVVRNQEKVVDGIFVSAFIVGDDGSQSGLAAGACGSGDGDEKGQLMVDFEDSFHFGETLFRAGGPGTDGLGAVHAGTSAETDDGLAVVGKIEIQGLLDVGSSGIGNSSVVDDAGDSGIGQSLFEALCEAELSDAAVGDEKDGIAVFLFQKSRDLLHASQNFRIAVGKERKSQLKCRLEDAAVNFL